MTQAEITYAPKPIPGPIGQVLAPQIESVKLAAADVVRAKLDLADGLVDAAAVDQKVEALRVEQGVLIDTRAVELGKAITAKDCEFEADGLSITVSDLTTRVDPKSGRTVLAYTVTATVTATGLKVPTDPDGYDITNPPTQVPNGTYRQELDAGGKFVDVQNFEESPALAFQTAVMRGVLGYARAQGFKLP